MYSATAVVKDYEGAVLGTNQFGWAVNRAEDEMYKLLLTIFHPDRK